MARKMVLSIDTVPDLSGFQSTLNDGVRTAMRNAEQYAMLRLDVPAPDMTAVTNALSGVSATVDVQVPAPDMTAVNSALSGISQTTSQAVAGATQTVSQAAAAATGSPAATSAAASGGTAVGNSFASSAGSAIKKIGATIAASFAVDMVKDFAKESFALAAEAEQNVGAVETVFGEGADAIKRFSETSSGDLGLSQSSYQSLASSMGGSLAQAGYSTEELTTKVNGLIGAGADLSSVFGGDAAEAAGAMGAGLRGEFDSLERFGVFLKQDAVNAEYAANATTTYAGMTEDAGKKQATVNLIMEQAAKYQGNFAREADTAAGAQQRANAKWEDAKAKLGESLIPVVSQAANWMGRLADFINQNSTAVTIAVGVIGGLVAAFVAVRVAVAAYTTVQAAMNIVLAANPIGLVVVAIGLLVAAFVTAYTQSETFRNTVNGALGAVRDTVVGAWENHIRPALEGIGRFFTETIPNGVNTLTTKVSEGWDGLTNRFNDGVQAIGNAWDSLKRLAGEPVRFVVENIINGGIIAGFNALGSQLPGSPRINPVPVPAFAAGGMIPGYAPSDDADNVVIRATPGEFMIPVPSVRRIVAEHGAAALERLRNGLLPGYASGGVIGAAKGAAQWAIGRAQDGVNGLINRALPSTPAYSGMMRGVALAGSNAGFGAARSLVGYANGGSIQGGGRGVSIHTTNYYPRAEPTSRTNERALQTVAALGIGG